MGEKRDIWLEAGMELLVESGPKGLTVAAVCRMTKKTKGSFYHHFSGMSDFQSELLEYWKEEHTLKPIRETREGEDALERLTELVVALPFSRETAFRDWAKRSGHAAKVVEEVDHARVGHLRSLFLQGGLAPEKAEAVAWMDYSLYLGVSMLGGSLAPQQRARMLALFERMVANDQLE